MAIATPCVYRSITLSPGEQFNLPPGATIIGSTNISSINSTCPIPTNLEQMKCYGFVIASHDDTDADTQVWVGDGSNPNIFYTGVIFSGVYYPFTVTAGYIATDIVTQLQSLSFGSALMNFCTSSSNDGTADSKKSYIIFNTFPSIGDNLELYGYTASPNNGSGTGFGNVYFTHPCELRSKIISDNHRDVCDCPAV